MNCLKRQIFTILCPCLLVLLFSGLVISSAQAKSNPKYASIVMDADSGMILSQRHADKILYPASLTKMMTLMMAFDALEKGKVGLRDRVYISRHAASMVPSKLDLPVGSSIRVEDAIYILVTKSANDIAVALGEKLAGTESQFSIEMTRKAWEIGMTKTRFRNASGLHNPAQVTTARDMARLAQHLINHYPKYYHYFGTQNFSYHGKNYRNHNRLLGKYRGMDGFKTGYIQASGFNLVASAKRDGHRVIGVVFGGRTGKSRNAHMKQILDRGFSKAHNIALATAKIPTPAHKPTSMIQVAALDNIAPSAGQATTATIEGNTLGAVPWAALNPMLQGQNFRKIIGEGDYDPAVVARLKTGLLAIAAHKKDHNEGLSTKKITAGKINTVKATNENWSIQIGAFASRVKTDQAIQVAMKTLPRPLMSNKTVIVPLKTTEGWLFRGRLSGYTKEQAWQACHYLKECLPVSPQAF